MSRTPRSGEGGDATPPDAAGAGVERETPTRETNEREAPAPASESRPGVDREGAERGGVERETPAGEPASGDSVELPSARAEPRDAVDGP